MFKKSLFAILISVFAVFAVLEHRTASGGGGHCNAVNPNNPNLSSNGERIFLTGVSKEGNSLATVKFRMDFPDEFFTGGAEHKKKIESGAMPCLRCHNFFGTGGIPFEYEGRMVKSANLVDIGAMKFTLEELRRAVSEGIGMDKRKLVPHMPRFDFTEKQLKDIKAFIQELPLRLDVLEANQQERLKKGRTL